MELGRPCSTGRNKLLFPCSINGPNFVQFSSPLYQAIAAFSWSDNEICKALTHLLGVGIVTRVRYHLVASVEGGLLFDVGLSDNIPQESIDSIPDEKWFPIFRDNYNHQLWKLNPSGERKKKRRRRKIQPESPSESDYVSILLLSGSSLALQPALLPPLVTPPSIVPPSLYHDGPGAHLPSITEVLKPVDDEFDNPKIYSPDDQCAIDNNMAELQPPTLAAPFESVDNEFYQGREENMAEVQPPTLAALLESVDNEFYHGQEENIVGDASTATGNAEDSGQQENVVGDEDEGEIVPPFWDGDEGVAVGPDTPTDMFCTPSPWVSSNDSSSHLVCHATETPVLFRDNSKMAGTDANEEESREAFVVDTDDSMEEKGADHEMFVDREDDVGDVFNHAPQDRKDNHERPERQAKRRLIFGKYVDLIACQANVEHAYKIVRRLTGSIGGNSYLGPIYGELTMTSMQKMVNLMIEHTGLGKDSGFIDVGSGIGKPNIHVAQYPGVAFSCGVEVEFPRWTLGMTNLKAVLQGAVAQQHANPQGEEEVDKACRLGGNTVFLHKDITEAKTFDPFSHVYMFSIGFPPPLWFELSKMWNRSQSPYLICYHGPKDIIHSYEFDVELVTQKVTRMHGSNEQHMGYIYRRRKSGLKEASTGACDALFAPSWELVKKGLFALHEDVAKQVDTVMGRGRKTRLQSHQMAVRMQTPGRRGVPPPETSALLPLFPRREADDSHDAAEAIAVGGDDPVMMDFPPIEEEEEENSEFTVFHDEEEERAVKVAAEARFEEEWAASNVASMPNDDDSGSDYPDDEGAKKPRAKRKSVEGSLHTDAEGAKKRKAVAARGDVAPVVAPLQSEYIPTSTNDGRNRDNRRCSGAPFGCPSKASQCSGRRSGWKWCSGIREKQIQVPENENECQNIIREFRRKMHQSRVAEHRARNK